MNDRDKQAVLAEYFADRARKAGLVGGKSKSPAKRKAAAENLKRARAARAVKHQHTADNQGLCHTCGIVLNPDWVEASR